MNTNFLGLIHNSVNLCAGITVASFCYLQFFPLPYDAEGIISTCVVLFILDAKSLSVHSIFFVSCVRAERNTETENDPGFSKLVGISGLVSIETVLW